MRFLPQPEGHREGMGQSNRGPGPKEGSVITRSQFGICRRRNGGFLGQWQSLGLKWIPQTLTQMQSVERVQGSISQGPLKK